MRQVLAATVDGVDAVNDAVGAIVESSVAEVVTGLAADLNADGDYTAGAGDIH